MERCDASRRASVGPPGSRGGAAANCRRPAQGASGELLTFRVEDLSVNYGATSALVHLTLEFLPGEIHAVLGENGAGKTTLANALGGLAVAASGRVQADGKIGYVHQHFAIPPGLTSGECLFVQESGLRFLPKRRLRERFRQIEQAVGLPLGDPEAVAASLPVGARQRLELARAAWQRPDLLILDEPTAVLAPPEMEAFAAFIRGVARRGAAVLFITHKLPEVFLLADRISLLRQGRLVFSRAVGDASPEEVAAEFLGPAPQASRFRLPFSSAAGRPILELDRLTVDGDRGEVALAGLCLELRAGEIVAVAGVDGNGQDELVECLAGLRRPRSGLVRLRGEPIDVVSWRRAGGSLVPGDRQREGLILDFSVEENLRLAEPLRDLAREQASRLVREFGILTPSLKTRVRRLSGGNQQKVVLARELSRKPPVLLAVSPTRGLDLASALATREALRSARDAGAAVLLVTSDLDEALEVGDSLYILYRGELSRRFPRGTAPAEIGRAMAGVA